jgi:predicted Zn finger-like uncharacterized protein
MADRILIQCPGCSAKLAITDVSKLGKKIRCSKCSEVFVAKALKPSGSKSSAPAKAAKPKPKKSDEDEFNFDDMELEDTSIEDEEEDIEPRPAKSKSASTKKRAKGKGKGKQPSGGNLPLLIGGAVAVVLLLGVGGYFLFRGGDDAPAAPQQALAAPQQPGAAPAPVAQVDSPNDKILALKWLPQDTEVIVHLKVADVWNAPLLKGLLSGPQVTGPIQQMQQVIGLTPSDVESFTAGLKNFQQLQGAGMMMAMGVNQAPRPPMLAVVRSRKPVDVSQLQQLIIQNSPGQSARLVDHNGKQYLEGPPQKPGAQPFGLWFADPSTLLVGQSDEVKAAMDRGETVTPRSEFRAIDASSHLLFVLAPSNPAMMFQGTSPPSPGTPPALAEMEQAIQSSLVAASLGISAQGGIALQSSLVFKDSAGTSKIKPGIEAVTAMARDQLKARQATTPPLLFELGEMLLTNLQVTEQNQVAKISTNIPDSAQQKLEQLPGIVIGMMAFGGGPFGQPGPGAPSASLPGVALDGGRDRQVAMNNLKQVGLAFHNYHDVHQKLPTAASVDASGKPLLSWRVHLLPFLGQQALYQQFKLDEPWDSDHNKSLISQMPAIFASPGGTPASSGLTRMLVPVGPGTIFDGAQPIGFRDITDGTSNTILCVEAHADAAVVWTSPDDLPVNLNDPLKNLTGARPEGILVLMCDGAVRTIQNTIDVTTLKALFTRNGGENVQPF